MNRSNFIYIRKIGRKGDFNVLLAVIVTLVVGLLFLIIGYQMSKNSKSLGDDEKCRLSIFAKAQLGKAQTGPMQFDAVSFECPRNTLKIQPEDVMKYNKIDDTLFKTVIAEEMKGCWSKVGAGKLDPFKSTTTVDEKFCMVCSDIRLDTDLQDEIKKENYEFKGFQYWIASNKLPGLKTSLYEYVRGIPPSAELLSSLKQNEGAQESRFDFNNRYVVVWRVEKLEVGWWETWGAIAGAPVIAAAGIFFIPAAAAITAGTAAATTGGLAGFGLGSIIADAVHGKISQQVLVVPEDVLSTAYDFKGDGKMKEFCTVMIN